MATSDESVQQHAQSRNQQANTSCQSANNQQNESSGIISGFLNKLTTTAEVTIAKSEASPDEKLKQQQQDRSGIKPSQGRPQIQRAKPVEIMSSEDGGAEKDQTVSAQKGFLSGLFSNASEEDTSSKLPSKINEPPKSSSNSGAGMLSGIFKSGTNEKDTSAKSNDSEKGFLDRLMSKQSKDESTTSVTRSTGSESNNLVSEASQQPDNLHPAAKSTQQYMEEIHRLLYGTSINYGYQDLLYTFAVHGVIPPELYEHQCLIEALLWQQLNDYALLEMLVPECYSANQMEMPLSSEPVVETPETWNFKNMDPSQFHIPSHPWQNVDSLPFQSSLPLAHGDDIIVFDMSTTNKKPWEGCDNLNGFSDKRTKKPWMEKTTAINLSEDVPAKKKLCQSVSDFSSKNASKITPKSHLDLKFDSRFLRRLTEKKGPLDLTPGAVDLRSTVTASEGIEDDMFFEDSEWYQQWLSLLEQGMWWPAEAGDCGYYVYMDEEYIYTLLTDRAGKHLYACATPEESRILEQITENISSFLHKKDKPKMTLCGFKIPLFNEDEVLWMPGKEYCDSQLLNAPVDFSSALQKGNRIMNMNLEQFSQMFQDSINAQTEQPVDFSVYKLEKVQMGSQEPSIISTEEQPQAADLSRKATNACHGGPYWINQGMKNFFPEVSVHRLSSPVTFTSSVGYREYPSTIKPSIPEIQIRYVDDKPVDQKTQSRETTLTTTAPQTAKDTALAGSTITSQPQATSRKPSDLLNGDGTPPTSTRKLPVAPTNSTKQDGFTPQSVTITPRLLPTPPTSEQVTTSIFSKPSAASQKHKLARQSSQSTSTSPSSEKASSFHSSKTEEVPLKPKPSTEISNKILSLPPPQNVLFNKPQMPVDSLLCSKPMDFSGTLSKKDKGKNEKTPTDAERSIQDIIDFTTAKLKVKKQNENTFHMGETAAVDLTVELNEEVKEINLTFAALEVRNLSVTMSDVPLGTVSAPASPRRRPQYFPPDSGIPIQKDSCGNKAPISPRKKPQLARQVPDQVSQASSIQVSPVRVLVDSPLKVASKLASTPVKLDRLEEGPIKQISKPSQVPTSMPLATSPHISPEIKTSPVLSPALRISTQNKKIGLTKQTSLVSESMRISHMTGQSYNENTAPANSVKATLDMTLKTANKHMQILITETTATEAVPLVRSRRASVTEINTDYVGLPLLVELSAPEVNFLLQRHQSLPQLVCSESRFFQEGPVLHGQNHICNITAGLPVHPSNDHQTATAPANAIKATLDMSAKSATHSTAVTEAIQKEALPLLRARSTSISDCNEELVGLPLLIEPLAQEKSLIPQRHPSLPHFSSNDLKSFHEDPVLPSQNRPYNRTTSLPVQLTHCHQTATAPANAIKATLDMSAKSATHSTAVTEAIQKEALPLVRARSTSISDCNEELVGLPLLIEPLAQEKSLIPQRHPSLPHFSSNDLKSFHEDPVLPSQNRPYNRTASLPVQLTHCHQIATAPANAIKATLDMSAKSTACSAMVTDVVQKEAFPLVRARSTSISDDNEEVVGMSLIVEPPTQQRKNVLMSCESQLNVRKSDHLQRVDMKTSQLNPALSRQIPSWQAASAPASAVKTIVNMSSKPIEKIKEDKQELSPMPLMKRKTSVTVIATGESAGLPLTVKSTNSQENLISKSSSPSQVQETLKEKNNGTLSQQSLEVSSISAKVGCFQSKCPTLPITWQSSILGQPNKIPTAPANTIKDIVDMSPKLLSDPTEVCGEVMTEAGVLSLIKTRPTSEARVLKGLAGVPLLVEHPLLPKLVRGQSKSPDKMSSFSLKSTRPIAQGTKGSSAPANTIKSTIDMSLGRPVSKKSEGSAGEMLPSGVMPLVKDKAAINKYSRKDSMGMSLIVDSFSCSEQVSQKTSPFISLLEEKSNPHQMQLLNGCHTTEPFLHQQISTYHRNGILSISKTPTVESHPLCQPIDFSVIVSPTKRNCSSVPQNGHPVDFTRSEEDKSRIGSRYPKNGSSTFKKSYVGAVDLTAHIMIDVNRNKNGDVKDLSSPRTTSISNQNTSACTAIVHATTTNKKDSYQLSGNEDILPPQSKNIAKPQPSFQSSVPTQMADISIQMKSHLHKTDLHISKPSVQLKKEQREPAEPTNARLLNKELPFASNTSVDSHGSHLSAQMSNSSKMVNFSDLPPKSMPHINCSDHTTNQQVAQRSIINRQVVTHQSIPLALTENEGTDLIFTSAATASTTVSRPKGIIKQSTVESLGEDCTPQSGTATFTGKPLALDNTLVQTSVIPVKLVQDVSIPDHGLSPNIVSTAATLPVSTSAIVLESVIVVPTSTTNHQASMACSRPLLTSPAVKPSVMDSCHLSPDQVSNSSPTTMVSVEGLISLFEGASSQPAKAISQRSDEMLPENVKPSQNVCFEFNQEMTTSPNWNKTADMSVISGTIPSTVKAYVSPSLVDPSIVYLPSPESTTPPSIIRPPIKLNEVSPVLAQVFPSDQPLTRSALMQHNKTTVPQTEASAHSLAPSFSGTISQPINVCVIPAETQSQENTSGSIPFPEVSVTSDKSTATSSCVSTVTPLTFQTQLKEIPFMVMSCNQTDAGQPYEISTQHHPSTVSGCYGQHMPVQATSQFSVPQTAAVSRSVSTQDTVVDSISPLYVTPQQLVLSEMMFIEETPSFIQVSPTELEGRSLVISGLGRRKMLIPQIMILEASSPEDCPSEEDTMTDEPETIEKDDPVINKTPMESTQGSQDNLAIVVVESQETDSQSIKLNLSNMVASPEALTEVSEIKHNSIDVLTNSDIFSAPLIPSTDESIYPEASSSEKTYPDDYYKEGGQVSNLEDGANTESTMCKEKIKDHEVSSKVMSDKLRIISGPVSSETENVPPEDTLKTATVMSDELSITSRPVSSETENIPSEDTPKTSTIISAEQSITSGPLSSGTENLPSEDTLKTSTVMSDKLSITSGPVSSVKENLPSEDTLKTSTVMSDKLSITSGPVSSETENVPSEDTLKTATVMSDELSITSRPVSSETENIPSEDTPKTSTIISGEQSITSGPLSSGTENLPSEDTLKTSTVMSDKLSITSGPVSSETEKVPSEDTLITATVMSEELSITSRPVSSETENIPSEDTPKTSTVMSGEQSITSGPLSSGTENVPSEDTLKTSKVISDELSITSGPMSSGAEKVDTLKTSIAKSETSTNEVEGQSSGPAKSHEEATPTSTEPVSFSTSVEEKSGKGIFSLFGTSSSGQIQPQSGKSILGGIPPGSSSPKEIPGTGLFSIFGSPGPQSTQIPSAPKEPSGKGLFSIFGGSVAQPQPNQQGSPMSGPKDLPVGPRLPHMHTPRMAPGLGPRGPPGHVPRTTSGPAPRGPTPRGPTPKEPLGKGLFSLFGESSQPTAPSGGTASKTPGSGSSILGGILPGSGVKENNGPGLFSMFGGGSSQCQAPTDAAVDKSTNKESTGKGLFSMFSGPSPMASSEPGSLFKETKSTGFRLMSFVDDKKSDSKPADVRADSLTCNVTPPPLTDAITDENTSVQAKEEVPAESTFEPSGKKDEELSDEMKEESTNDTGRTDKMHSAINYDSKSEMVTLIKETEEVAPLTEKQAEKEETPTVDKVHEEQTINEKLNEERDIKNIKETVATSSEKTNYVTPINETEEIVPVTKEQSKNEETSVVDKMYVEQNNNEQLKIEELDVEIDKETVATGPDSDKDLNQHVLEKSSEQESVLELFELEKPSEVSLESENIVEPEKSSESQDPVQKNMESEECVELENSQQTNKPLDSEKPSENEKSLTEGTGKVDDVQIAYKISAGSEKDTVLTISDSQQADLKEKSDEITKLQESDKTLIAATTQPYLDPQLISSVQQQQQPKQDTIVPQPGNVGFPAQPRPRMAGPFCQPRHVMPDPRGPRPAISNQPRPRMPGPQRHPEPAAFSGFMSMFSGPSASSKPVTSSFFSVPQTSFFKSSPPSAPAQQQKSSFFNLPTSLQTDSLTGDLFGLFKGTEAAIPDETKLPEKGHDGTQDSKEQMSLTASKSSAVSEPESTVASAELVNEEQLKQGGSESLKLVEEKEFKSPDETKYESKEITETSETIPIQTSESGLPSKVPPGDKETPPSTPKAVVEDKLPTSPPAKGIFALPGLSTSSLGGLMSGTAAETAKPFSSFFGSSTPAPSVSTNTSQPQAESSGLLSGLKGLSAGLFQEEKSASATEETMSSMFGRKIGFPWQSSPQTLPATQSKDPDLKPEENDEPEADKLSLESEVTGSADPSDTEGPSDNSSHKQPSFDTSPESPTAFKQGASCLEVKHVDKSQISQDCIDNDKDLPDTDSSAEKPPESLQQQTFNKRLVKS